MNAAAKIINQSNVFHGAFSEMYVSKSTVLQIFLFLALLLSAFVVVYVTNLQRLTLDQLQMAEQRTHQLEVQWGQLMLEQASLAAPSRVETFATERLRMVMPDNKQTL